VRRLGTHEPSLSLRLIELKDFFCRFVCMKPAHLILLLLMNFCWASVYSAYKVLALPTGGIVTLRFALAAIVLLLAWPWLPGKAPRGADLVKSCLLGVVSFVVGQRLQVYGNEIGSASNSAVLMSFEPLITTCAAALVLKEQLGPRRIVGFALAIAGVGLLNGVWRRDFKMASMAASFIFISSFICEAIFSVVAKPVIMRASIMKMLAISLAIGTVMNLAIDGQSTLRAARMLSTFDWGVLALLGVVCTAIGYSVWFLVIRECPVSVAALTIFAQTVFGVLVAAVWLGEKLKREHLAGSLTIIAGLVIGLSRQVHAGEAARKV